MEETVRKSGLDIIGDVSWGTHFCQFYQTKEDLLDILVPYFKAGLENNEFCIWVTSKPLVKEEAEKAMRNEVPHFDQYRERGQIEIIPYDEWYLKDGVFNSKRVLNDWIDKLNQALDNGYDGMRLTGNTFWLNEMSWNSFTEYEEEVNSLIGNYRMIAICAYSLDRCGASEIIDVVSNHEFALIRKKGTWSIIESSDHKLLEKALLAASEKYRSFVQNFHGIAYYRHIDFRPIFLHGALEEITGYTEEMFISGNVTWDKIIHPEDLAGLSELFEKMRSIPKYADTYEYRIIRKDGQVRWILEYCQNLCDDSGKPIIVRGARYNITKRKLAEEALKDSEEKYRDLFENSTDFVYTLDLKGNFTNVNRSAERLTGYTRAELIGMNFRNYTTKESCGKVFRVFRRLFMTGDPLQDFPFEVIIKDGSKKYFETSAALISKGNKIRGFQGISRDVTERRFNELRKHALQTVSEKIWDMKKPEDIKQVAKAVKDGLEEQEVPFRNCGINIINTVSEPPQVFSYNFIGEQSVTTESSVIEKNIIVQIWREGKPAYRKDLCETDTYGERENIEKLFSGTVRSVIDIPFSQGTLAVSSPEPDAFSERDSTILNEMAQALTEGFKRMDDLVNLEKYTRELEEEIEERKEAENLILASERKYRDIYDKTPVSIWVHDCRETFRLLDTIRDVPPGDLDVYFDRNPGMLDALVSSLKLIDVNNETLRIYGAQTKDDIFREFGKHRLPK